MPPVIRTRQESFWDLHDFGTGRGLEIGPLHRAIVTREQADVHYVDVHDQAGLRAHYDGDESVPAELIPEIDYWLIQDDGRTLSLAEATTAGAPFAWVVASHVIEHVPDVIGWLDEIAEVVDDGAALVLAVPDRRYCFDVLRPPTTVGQMIQAHEDRDQRPSVRAVYDYVNSTVACETGELWRGALPTYADRLHPWEAARDKAAEASAGTYVDCHVWLFSPQGFLEQLHELRVTGRSVWMVERLEPTRAGVLEFHVVLRRLPRGSDTTAEVAAELLPSAERPDWLVVPERSELVEALDAEVAELRDRLRERRLKLRQLRDDARRRTEADRVEIAGLRAELAAVRESRQWRAGAAALAPVRAVGRLRRR